MAIGYLLWSLIESQDDVVAGIVHVDGSRVNLFQFMFKSGKVLWSMPDVCGFFGV